MRLRQLDFLRGIAVLLVLMRHYALADFFITIGWVGVDLFFVLSGFLVSGLLFHEYMKYNNIKPGLFLIRRGLKIYPMFYFAILLTITLTPLYNHLQWTNDVVFRRGLLAEIFFLQSYGGFLWGHTWSLSVEEHFYISLAVIIFILYKKNLLTNRKVFTGMVIFIAVACLSLRIINNINRPFSFYTHLWPTHLRIDSLMFGVFLSYMYNYEKEKFLKFFRKYKYFLLPLGLLFVSTCVFFEVDTFFMNTFGLTFLYLGFGIILSIVMSTDNINSILNKIFGKITVNAISRIGFYSYSIYLWHVLVLRYVIIGLNKLMPFEISYEVNFFIYFFASIFVGIGASKLIEQRFLTYRDKHFPSRSKAVNPA